jgi:molybdopterin-guanine dinucleotide biosynthesis protein
MSHPIVIQIIGMHGVGKTTVATKAAELFERNGLRVATLDVDHFAHAYLAKRVNPKLDEKTHLFAIADSVKGKIAHNIGLGAAKTNNAFAVKAIRQWVEFQDVDVVLLEMHWLAAVRYYRHRDEVWLVTALAKRRGAHIRSYKIGRPDGLLKSSQKHWKENHTAIPRELRYIPNESMDLSTMQKRLARFVECLYHEAHQPLSEPN